MADFYDIGLDEALARTLGGLHPLPPVVVDLSEARGLVAGGDMSAIVDCPSVNTSLKDGFAVCSVDLEGASEESPVKLRVTGRAVAGGGRDAAVASGTAVEVMTGAEIPPGADAVLAVEFTRREDSSLICLRDAGPGRNVMERATDVAAGEVVAARGQVLTPALTGLLAAGGVSSLSVHPAPRVGVVAIGDEVVLPGKELDRGQLYASNVVTLTGWLEHFRLRTEIAAVGDREEDIAANLAKMLETCDAVLTSGGAWKSDRDLTVKAVKNLGGELLFHRVRIGPGKAAALVLVSGKPVFCLPGGPASNEMAFLQIALPGLLRLAGRDPRPFPIRRARLSEELKGVTDWTQFFQADLRCGGGEWNVAPIRMKSRLRSQARANALLKLPEGESRMRKGEEVAVQVLFRSGETS